MLLPPAVINDMLRSMGELITGASGTDVTATWQEAGSPPDPAYPNQINDPVEKTTTLRAFVILITAQAIKKYQWAETNPGDAVFLFLNSVDLTVMQGCVWATAKGDFVPDFRPNLIAGRYAQEILGDVQLCQAVHARRKL